MQSQTRYFPGTGIIKEKAEGQFPNFLVWTSRRHALPRKRRKAGRPAGRGRPSFTAPGRPRPFPRLPPSSARWTSGNRPSTLRKSVKAPWPCRRSGPVPPARRPGTKAAGPETAGRPLNAAWPIPPCRREGSPLRRQDRPPRSVPIVFVPFAPKKAKGPSPAAFIEPNCCSK